MYKKLKGFTILQMILTVALIAILASIVFIAINPGKNFAETRNEQRASDLKSLTNGLQQYTVNNQGQSFPGMDNNLRIIGTATTGCAMACTIVNAQGDPVNDYSYTANTASAFNAGTYSNTTFNTTNQTLELNAAGKTARFGSYTSPIIDATSPANWSLLQWAPLDKYNFPLPNNKATVDTGAAGVINMSNNQLLLHLDGLASAPATDSSGTGNNGTNFNTSSVNGRLDKAMQFNGSSSYIRVPNNASLNPVSNLTVEAWVKWNITPSTGSPWAQILSKNGDSQYQLQHSQTNSAFEFALQTSVTRRYLLSTTHPAQGVWYHIVGTYDGTSTKLFVNGVQENSITQTGTINTSGVELNIGRRSNLADRYFNGDIDEVAIYNRTLTPAEILSHYNSGSANLKFQVRSCTETNCLANSFIGPDGTPASFFEAGKLDSMIFDGSLIGRYFQYKANFETGNNSFTPRISSINISSQSLNVVYSTSQDSCLDLSPLINDIEMVTIPKDPATGTSSITQYGIRLVNGTTQLYACNSELDQLIMRSFH